MTRTEQEKIMKKALDHYGVDAQIDKCIEECAELINALCKYKQKRCQEHDVITEIADVTIMMWQMADVFGYEKTTDEYLFKLNRLKDRIKKEVKQ